MFLTKNKKMKHKQSTSNRLSYFTIIWLGVIIVFVIILLHDQYADCAIQILALIGTYCTTCAIIVGVNIGRKGARETAQSIKGVYYENEVKGEPQNETVG